MEELYEFKPAYWGSLLMSIFMQELVCFDEAAYMHIQRTNWVSQAVPLTEMHLFRLAC